MQVDMETASDDAASRREPRRRLLHGELLPADAALAVASNRADEPQRRISTTSTEAASGNWKLLPGKLEHIPNDLARRRDAGGVLGDVAAVGPAGGRLYGIRPSLA